jgi:type IV pilus assembly protein PilN
VIRTNLATRPFYNERAVHTWLLVVAALVVLATLFNVTRVLRYSRSDTQLAGEATRDESRAGDLRTQAARLRASVDPRQIDFASNEARMANDLIDRRTFSWTELLNRFETALPDDVRITSVRPQIDKQRGIVLNIAVVARTNDDVQAFIDRLHSTNAFPQVLAIEEHADEAGMWETSLEAIYSPGAARPAAEGAARR